MLQISACYCVWGFSSACIAIAWLLVLVKWQGDKHEQELSRA